MAEFTRASALYGLVQGDNPALLGYASVDYDQALAVINKISITPKYQGLGLGWVFWRELELEFLNKGAGEVQLEVSEKNTTAIGLYRKAGFEEIYRRKNYYSINITAIVMRKILEQMP